MDKFESTNIVSEKNKNVAEYVTLLSLLNGLFEKQEMLVSMESQELVQGYGYTDTNCIDLIGIMENPNVTKLASKMDMSKSAISKMMKRLIADGLVESYRREENRKEVYFKLTDAGWILFEAHRLRHQLWENRDYEFLCSLDLTMVKIVTEFMQRYNKFLENRIKSMNDIQ